MKAYTDLEQSKKLAEILPLESADMRYSPLGDNLHPWIWTDTFIEKDAVPCWSLAALLGVLSLPLLSLDEQEDGERKWYVTHDTGDARYDSYYRDEPIDACYELILRLHELKML